MRTFSAVSVLFLTLGSVAGQLPADTKTQSINDKANAELLRWREGLPQLVLDSRTLQDQNARPEAMAAVADAYWELDQSKAKELFLAALDLAIAIDASSKERDPAIRMVVTSAARRDPELAKAVIKRLQSAKDRESRGQAIAASIDLLQIDRSAAQNIALASSQFGPSFDSAWFIFELQKQDPAAADRVYSAYLNNVNPGKPSQLLWLAGYPFGYVEAFGGSSDPLQFTGVFGLSSSSLTANPVLAPAFLATATQVVNQTLQQSTGVPPEQLEVLNGLVFFISAYLSPEIARYRPDLANRWLAIQQTTGAGITANRRQEILNKVTNIVTAREQASQKNGEKEISVDDLLAQAEKSSSTCQRDSVYARAMLQLDHHKDFKRAISFADRIDGLDLRAQTLQFVYYDMAVASIEKKTPAALDEASQNAERVTSPEQRGLLYMRMAESWRTNGDRDRAYALLLKAGESLERAAEPAVRAGLLFAVAYDLADLDPGLVQAIRMMKDAIHLLNQNKSVKIDQISVLRRLDLGCESKNGTWYGSSDKLGRFDLIETLVKFAGSDAATAEELARNLVEGPNRIRALAAIAGSEIRAARVAAKGNVRQGL